jgi:valyl-tRNA synthetase
MISGYVLLGKEKMSKSKGNVIEPMEYLEKYGMDALRYWASTSKLGEDVMFDEKEFIAATRLVKKLWNAFNFFKIHLENKPIKPKKLEKVDEYLLLELEKTIKGCTNYFDNYEYSHARACVEKFFWQIFCDNYLEIIKGRIYGQDKEKKLSAQYAVYQTFLNVVKLFAPIMPCITEDIYQSFFKEHEKSISIHVSKWPEVTIKKFTKEHEKLEKQGQEMFRILEDVRKTKAKAQKSMKAEITLTLKKETKELLGLMMDDLKSVTNAKEIKEGEFKVEFL